MGPEQHHSHSAAVRDGQLHLSVRDDARGFDVSALRSAAVASGAVSPDGRQLLQTTRHDRLIPGLSRLLNRCSPGWSADVVAEVYAPGGTISCSPGPGGMYTCPFLLASAELLQPIPQNDVCPRMIRLRALLFPALLVANTTVVQDTRAAWAPMRRREFSGRTAYVGGRSVNYSSLSST